ncbi:transferase, partial [Streptomyces sp. SID9727]|nr:transferase [Streptomyces sp. SID9727]
AGALWAAGTAEFAWARIAPGPRTGTEVATMLATSVVIPPLAVLHRGLGGIRHRRASAWGGTG